MQRTLELESPHSGGETLAIPGADLRYWPTFYPTSVADHYLHTFIRDLPWRQDHLNFGGKQVPVPRLQAWFGDPASRYGYSGLALSPQPWTPDLLSIKQHIEFHTGARFNAVLVNYYRDGRDSVAWHRDNEKELGPDPIVASLSLGVTRRFELKHQDHKDCAPVHCELEHGSLLLMGKGVQRHWLHRAPKQAGITQSRLNLTFRLILSAAK